MAGHVAETYITLMLESVRKALNGDLTVRIPLSGSHDALDELAAGVNELLAKCEQGSSAASATEEERLRLIAILESTSDMISTADPEGRLSYINSSGRKMAGWGESESLDGHLLTELHPAWASKRIMEEGIPSTLERGIWHGETAILHRDGREIPVSQMIMAHRGPGGELRYLSTIIRDMTDRNRFEEALQESESRYRLLAENAGDIIFTMDTNLQFTYISPSVTKMRGYTVEEAMAQSPAEALTPASLELAMKTFLGEVDAEASGRRAMEKNIVLDLEENCKDGSTIWTESTFSPLRDHDGRITGFLGITRDISEGKLAKEALSESERRYREILEEIEDGYYEVDLKGNFTFFNRAMAEILRYDPDEMLGMNYRAFMSEESARKVLSTFNRIFLTGTPTKAIDWEFVRKDRTLCIVETSVSLIRDENGTARGFRGILRDVTEQKTLQERLSQAQKMESVGKLAGGIAHDFNNMLTPIMGYAELLKLKFPDDKKYLSHVEQIIRSAERSRDLVRQLLAFARKQTLEMKPIDLNHVVANFEKMLRRTLHEDVVIRTNLEPSLGSIMADIGQVEQIILNLSVNAQDAMPEGGILLIETRDIMLDEGYAVANEGVPPGPYVMLAVSDTGLGIDREVIDRMFEPFFTTKGPGKGTGLGLATVYGIVKQHGGHVTVTSRPGEGTIFRVFFPRHDGAAGLVPEEDAPPGRPPYGSETILVVEDEDMVRAMVVSGLMGYGYEVLEARDGQSALELSKNHPGPIHLVVSDVVLSDVNGRSLFEEISVLRRDLRVLFMSGYSKDVISHHSVLDEGINFIQKPFSVEALATKARAVLDRD